VIVMGKLDVALINARILWRQISYQQSDTGPMQYFLLSILCVTSFQKYSSFVYARLETGHIM
jgi:hypothetical protein